MAPRTNADMYKYRMSLEEHTCELMHRADEIVQFVTLDRQNYIIPIDCLNDFDGT